jgi:hypothetical protein
MIRVTILALALTGLITATYSCATCRAIPTILATGSLTGQGD